MREPTEEEKSAMCLYAELMEEVRVRIEAIKLAYKSNTDLLPYFRKEFCFLQLRMICELIALGCLVANGTPRVGKLRKMYRAEEIMKALEKLHPDFYPVPITMKRTSGGLFMGPPSGKPFLSKRDLLTLNAKCGERMHRGNYKKLISPNLGHPPTNWEDVSVWSNKIVHLLSTHKIALLSRREFLFCALSDKANDKRVTVHFGGPSANH